MTAFNLGLSLINQILLAKHFGASISLDAYLVAFALPSLFSGIATTFFNSSLIPILTSVKNDKDTMSNAISSIALYSAFFSLVILIAGMSFRKYILIHSTNLVGVPLDLAIELSGYIWLITGISIMNSFLSCLYNLYKNFVYPALMQLLPTLGMLIGIYALSGAMGIRGLVIGWMGMTIISFLLQISILHRVGLKFNSVELKNRYAKEFLLSLLPIIVGILPYTILPVIDAYWASQLKSGSLSYIGYCTRLVVALGSLIINGVSIVILPYLAEDIANDDESSFTSKLYKTITSVLVILIPIVVLCIYSSNELVSALFQRGEFNADATDSVASLLIFYLVGLLAMLPAIIISRGYIAKKKFMALASISIFHIVCYFLLSGLFIKWLSYYGIGLAYSIYWLSYVISISVAININFINKYNVIMLAKVVLISITGILFLYFIKISFNVYIFNKYLTLYVNYVVYFVLLIGGGYYLNLDLYRTMIDRAILAVRLKHAK